MKPLHFSSRIDVKRIRINHEVALRISQKNCFALMISSKLLFRSNMIMRVKSTVFITEKCAQCACLFSSYLSVSDVFVQRTSLIAQEECLKIFSLSLKNFL